jgi:macrolide transport system ATP-binding/permease protein
VKPRFGRSTAERSTPPREREDVLIQVRGGDRRYTASTDWAIHDCELEIHRGDFVAITGPSGAGKSTLLNCLALLDRFDQGEYLLNGIRIDQMRAREWERVRGEQFGFVFQSSNAIESRSVAKNVEVPLSSLGVPVAARTALVALALEKANILHRAGQDVSLLSGGERQRVAIARSLVTNPRVLFLDEPTGNLDSKNTSAVIELLQHLNRTGTTIVFVTHDAQLAAAASHQVLVNDGIVSQPPRAVPATTAGTPAVEASELGTEPLLALHIGGSFSLRRIVLQQFDAVSEAVFSLVSQPARTLMALLAIGLGVAGLVAGVNLGVTANSQIDKLVTGAALDQVYVDQATPSESEAPTDFGPAAAQKILQLSGVETVGNLDIVDPNSAQVKRYSLPHNSAYSIQALGVTSSTFTALDIALPAQQTSLFDSAPISSNIVAVGTRAAKSLGLHPGTPQTIWISGTRFDVIAIVRGTPRDPSVIDSVLISHTAVQQLHLLTNHQFVVKTVPGRGYAVGTAIPYQLNPQSPGHFIASGTANLQNLRQGISTSLNSLLLALAAVFLGIAILSTASTMTNSVLQRAGEIGLRMATGSSPTKIAGLFLAEGATLGLIGGLLGSSSGVITVLVVSTTQHWVPALDPTTIGLGMGIGFITGLLAAIVPSIRASKTQPALALRK